MRTTVAVAALVAALGMSVPALADDWVAVKLRGVVVSDGGDGQWVPLKRGDVVSDARTIRTMGDGHAEFERDGETIDMAANTTIQIHDRAYPHFTTVSQGMGSVTISDQHQSTPHFAVQTPFVAAVVKGTVFTVKSTCRGSSVAVARGAVQVEDKGTHTFVSIVADQHASAGRGQPLAAAGAGTLQPITNAQGQVVSAPAPGGGEVAAVQPAGPPAKGGPAPKGPEKPGPAGKPTPPDKPSPPEISPALRISHHLHLPDRKAMQGPPAVGADPGLPVAAVEDQPAVAGPPGGGGGPGPKNPPPPKGK